MKAQELNHLWNRAEQNLRFKPQHYFIFICFLREDYFTDFYQNMHWQIKSPPPKRKVFVDVLSLCRNSLFELQNCINMLLKTQKVIQIKQLLFVTSRATGHSALGGLPGKKQIQGLN